MPQRPGNPARVMLRGPKGKQRYALDLHKGYKAEQLELAPYRHSKLFGLMSKHMFLQPPNSREFSKDPCCKGPFSIYKMVNQRDWGQVNVLDTGKYAREDMVKAILNGKAQSKILENFSKLFEDDFQLNYTDTLLISYCKQLLMADYIPSMVLSSSSIQNEIDQRVFQDTHQNCMVRTRNAFFGIWNSNNVHYVAYVIVFPIMSGMPGFVLILDPYGESPFSAVDSVCLMQIHQLVKYIACVKAAMKVLPDGTMPVFHTVHVHHPREFTQNASFEGRQLFKTDCACNFWCTILLFIWMRYFEKNCNMSVSCFSQELKDMFLTETGEGYTYDFYKINRMYGCMRDPEYTMCSLRIYTALFLQQFYQFSDLIEAKELLKGTPLGSPYSAVELFDFDQTKVMLTEGMKVKKTVLPYVMAGSEGSYEHYMQLCTLCESCADPLEKKKFLEELPSLDLYRLLCGLFFDRRVKGESDSVEFYRQFMTRILVYHPNDHEIGTPAEMYTASPTIMEWIRCPYRIYRENTLLPENVKFIDRDAKPSRGSAKSIVLELDQEEPMDP